MSFWPILEASVYASVVILLVLLLKWLFGEHMTARWHLLLWLLVCVRLLALPFPDLFELRSSVSLWNTADIAAAEQAAARAADRYAWEQDAGGDILPVVTNLTDPARDYRAVPAVSHEGLARAGETLYRVWLAGAAALLALYILAALRLHLRALRCPKAGEALEMRVDRLWHAYALAGGPPRCRIAPAGESPYVCGLFAPVLVVPAPLADRLDDRVLLHELCHVAHSDIAKNWFITLLRCAMWFNPLFWLACDRAADDLELCCDETVLTLLASEDAQLGYGHALLDLALPRFRYRPGTSCIANREPNIRRRIRRIARRKEISGRAKAVGVMIWIAMLVSVVAAPQPAAAHRWEGGTPSDHVAASLAAARLHRASGPSEAAYLYGKAYALDCGYYLWQVADENGRAALEQRFADNQAAGDPAVWRFDDTVTQNYWYDFLVNDGITEPTDADFADYYARPAGFGVYDLMGAGDRYTAVIGYPVTRYQVVDESGGEVTFTDWGRYYWDEIEIVRTGGRWQVRRLTRGLSVREWTEGIARYDVSRTALYRADDGVCEYEMPVSYVQAYTFYRYNKTNGTWQDAPTSNLFGWGSAGVLLPGSAQTGYCGVLRFRPKNGDLSAVGGIHVSGTDDTITASWGGNEAIRYGFTGEGGGSGNDFEFFYEISTKKEGRTPVADANGFYDLEPMDSAGGDTRYETPVRSLLRSLAITARSTRSEQAVSLTLVEYAGEEVAP